MKILLARQNGKSLKTYKIVKKMMPKFYEMKSMNQEKLNRLAYERNDYANRLRLLYLYFTLNLKSFIYSKEYKDIIKIIEGKYEEENELL